VRLFRLCGKYKFAESTLLGVLFFTTVHDKTKVKGDDIIRSKISSP
jgi:hypothetical protein